MDTFKYQLCLTERELDALRVFLEGQQKLPRNVASVRARLKCGDVIKLDEED